LIYQKNIGQSDTDTDINTMPWMPDITPVNVTSRPL